MRCSGAQIVCGGPIGLPDPRAVTEGPADITSAIFCLMAHLDKILLTARLRHSMTFVVPNRSGKYRWQGGAIFTSERQIWQYACNEPLGWIVLTASHHS